ncbi:MAG: anthranilate phosphoribosyltransferase [Nitrososphaeraceae archaeon]
MNNENNKNFLKKILIKIIAGNKSSEKELNKLFSIILENNIPEIYISSILVALATKGETSEEIYCLVKSITKNAIKIKPNVKKSITDTCGTGGDKLNSFNISTAAAIVSSSSGCVVAKHGNRSSSGICGSADFLEFIGFNLSTEPEKISKTIEQLGIGFLFAPKFHPALKKFSKMRRDLGVKTIFNIAGPLSNPCINIRNQIIGVYEPDLIRKILHVSKKMKRDVMVLHSDIGMDELSNAGKNQIFYLKNGKTSKIEISLNELGIKKIDIRKLIVKSKEESVKLTLESIYGNAPQEIIDIVVLNSAASLVVSKTVKSFKEGVEISKEVIKQELARKKLKDLIDNCGDRKKLYEIENRFKLT